MEIKIPNHWIQMVPRHHRACIDIDMLAYPNRPPHRRVTMRRIWLEGMGVKCNIHFRATKEEMLEDALVLLQEFLLLNPRVRLTSVWVGAEHARIDQTMSLKRKYCAQYNRERFKFEGGGRQVLRLRNAKRAFAPLLSNE